MFCWHKVECYWDLGFSTWLEWPCMYLVFATCAGNMTLHCKHSFVPQGIGCWALSNRYDIIPSFTPVCSVLFLEQGWTFSSRIILRNMWSQNGDARMWSSIRFFAVSTAQSFQRPDLFVCGFKRWICPSLSAHCWDLFPHWFKDLGDERICNLNSETIIHCLSCLSFL